ncbi:MAG: hypothetical protein IPQ25_17970 [Chitinophagaceae bacterium]|nr:hypothetical protein [Chitinophagaceae bacterium]
MRKREDCMTIHVHDEKDHQGRTKEWGSSIVTWYLPIISLKEANWKVIGL